MGQGTVANNQQADHVDQPLVHPAGTGLCGSGPPIGGIDKCGNVVHSVGSWDLLWMLLKTTTYYFLTTGSIVSFPPSDRVFPEVPEGFSNQNNHFPPCFVDQSSANTNQPNGSDATKEVVIYLAGYLEVSYRATVYLRSTE